MFEQLGARWRRVWGREEGLSTLEWIGLTAVTLVFIAGALYFAQTSGWPQLMQTVSDRMDCQVRVWEQGGACGGGGDSSSSSSGGGFTASRGSRSRRDREDRRIESDRRRRREEGGTDSGSWTESDWAGRMILERYLTGGGDWEIANDPDWTRYMEANEMLQEDMRDKALEIAQGLFSSGNQSLDVYESFSQEIQNGESIVGYQYLHGTNQDVGGFEIDGTATLTPDGTGYIVELDLSYTWNDVIDPNPEYTTDTFKERIAELFTIGRADPYDIHITWDEKTTIKLDASGNVVSVEGDWLGD